TFSRTSGASARDKGQLSSPTRLRWLPGKLGGNCVGLSSRTRNVLDYPQEKN
ncbi:hypothetical protein ACJX0J_011512, partial [Zea mays]